MKLFNTSLNEKYISFFEVALITLMAVFPLFFNLPYRDNIYLSWEGAYRMYLGQMPFKDFGLPLGYGFWLVPALFFKIFGPFMHSLIKAQVLINIVSGLAFRSILKSCQVERGVRLMSVFVFVISYSFINFWPWYNHTVIVFELIGLAFVLSAITQDFKVASAIKLIAATLFLFLSFFTKQDGGAFAILIASVLVLYHLWSSRDFRFMLVYAGGFVAVTAAFILPLLPHDFLYWFNHGQPPHNSRVSLFDISNEVFGASWFLKMYLVMIVLITLKEIKERRFSLKEERSMLFLLLTLGIIFQALILQVTSYVPEKGNIYFHSFCLAYIVGYFGKDLDFSKLKNLLIMLIAIFFWWSGSYWKYANRIFNFKTSNGQNRVGINSFTINRDTTLIDATSWELTKYEELKKITVPKEAKAAFHRLAKMDVFSRKERPKVLNMSEYTPLASILDFELEVNQPLWYHLNVAMFDKHLKEYQTRIENHYYDVVLFEIIPDLNNFYPFAIRDILQEEYQLIDTFQAPRDKTYEVVEVYIKRK